MSIELFKRFVSSIVLLPLTFFFVIKGSFIFNFFLGTIFLLSCKEWNYLSHNKKYKLIGYFFIFFSCLTVFLIRNNSKETSLEIFILILLICIGILYVRKTKELYKQRMLMIWEFSL